MSRQRRTLDAIKRILLRESLNQPLLLMFEDLHWVDAQTQALLDLLADAIANARVLLLVNYRPEYRHGWGSKTHYAQLRLDPLGQESAEELLGALLGDDSSFQALKGLIIEKTHGNPFFMEETVQVLLDEGVLVRNGAVKLTKPLSELHIPPTVQVILAARIDRLPADEKDLLQTLAVMGKEFPLGLVKKVTGKSDDELERMLGDLQLGEFIYEQPALPDAEYSFKHSLTLEVAYSSVLTERRRVLHERTAAAIESLYAERLDDHLAELVHQYRQGGNLRKAIEYLGRAGEQAAAKGAENDAITHLGAAIELISKLSEDQSNRLQEIRLRILIGPSLMVVKGQGSSETGVNYMRALELCQQAADTSLLFEALSGLWIFHLVRTEYRDAAALAQQLLASAPECKDSSILSLQISRSVTLRSGAANSKPPPSTWHGRSPGVSRGDGCLRFSLTIQQYTRESRGWAQHYRGYPDQARATASDCIEVARQLSIRVPGPQPRYLPDTCIFSDGNLMRPWNTVGC